MSLIKYTFVFLEVSFLILGVYLPLAKMKEFWLFKSEFSILSISYQFLVNNEHLLFFIVFFFGLVFPLIKIISRTLKLEMVTRFNLHRFSMIDVFLISLLVFIGKSSSFFEIQLGTGFYFLVLSVFIGYFFVIFEK
tara:strand:+ start:146 stop:553 length:408 start_codon:yes stop_codon:yes gene_type:complete